MTIKNKLKGKSGFTLAETLLAVLIMLLVSTIVANGIPVARNVYNNVIVGANAQMLLSTAVTALRNELGTAQDVTVDTNNNTDITYYKPSIGAYSKLSVNDEGIQLLDYVNKTDGTPLSVAEKTGSRTPERLVTKAASNGDLIVTYDSASVSGDIITFSKLEVKRETGSKSTLVTLDKLKIRLVPVAG